ncbi:MAG: TolC family protein [Muribaculaceae bacterium]|nr:TolC family protein [Muribaculaceae bacterium]
MKIIRLISLSICLAACVTSATATTWSLDSCINYAIENNIDVKSALLERYRGELTVTEAKDRFLPTLSGGASQNWAFGRGLTAQNTYANRNTSSFGVNAQLSLPVFQGLTAIRQLEQARASLSALDLQVEATRDDVTLSVMSYYLQALYNRELVAVAEEELRLSTTQLTRQQDLFEAGKVPEVDVLQAKAQVATNEVSLVNARNDYDLALVELQRALQLGDTDGFDIAPIEDTDGSVIPTSSQVYENALTSNSGIRAARANINVADKAISLARTGMIPKLYFSAGLSTNYYGLSGADNPAFSRQMKDNFAKSLGFSLQVPIFDAFSTRNSIRRAKTQKLTAELELERKENDLLRTIRQAHSQAVGAQEKYRAGETAVEASKVALDAMTEKYTYGKANATEWEQARSTYITTLARQVQAKYEKILRTRILRFYNTGSN